MENNGWLKEILVDHSQRLGRIEDTLNRLTGKVYANAALVSAGVSIATILIVKLILGGL